jgi:hypothetical protein
MKKVLLLGALLSTMAFGTSVSGTIEDSSIGKSATATVNLNGNAIRAIEISTTTKNVNFGTILVGQTSKADVTFTIEGAQGKSGTLSANVSTTSGTSSYVTASFENSGSFSLASGESTTEKLTLSYAPEAVETLTGTVTVTATYTD